jgi:hypothetical protein
MDYGEQTTGTRDEHYNLVSVLYHALSGADTCDRYALDAEAAGDERLAAFFREGQVLQTELAERAKGLLGIIEPPPEFGAGPAPGGRKRPPEAAVRKYRARRSATSGPIREGSGSPNAASRPAGANLAAMLCGVSA